MKEQKKIDPKSNKYQTTLFVFIILVIVILPIGGYLGYQDLMERIEGNQGNVEKVLMQEKQTQGVLGNIQDSIENLQLDYRRESKLNNSKGFSLVIIEHLVRMADLTLNTSGDVKLAISFLSAAREHVQSMGLSVVDHALNKDIEQLKSVQAYNLSDLVVKIESLNKKLSFLPLLVENFSGQKDIAPQEEKRIDKIWKKVLNSGMESLKGVVSIRRQNTEPLLVPEQERILRLNMQSKLLQAEFAVMQRQNELYQTCLKGVLVLVKRYFVANSDAAKEILSMLKELQLINLSPKLPHPTATIAALMDFSGIKKNENVQLKK